MTPRIGRVATLCALLTWAGLAALLPAASVQAGASLQRGTRCSAGARSGQAEPLWTPRVLRSAPNPSEEEGRDDFHDATPILRSPVSRPAVARAARGLASIGTRDSLTSGWSLRGPPADSPVSSATN